MDSPRLIEWDARGLEPLAFHEHRVEEECREALLATEQLPRCFSVAIHDDRLQPASTIAFSLRVTAPSPDVARVSIGRRQFSIGKPLEFDEASPHLAAIEYALGATNGGLSAGDDVEPRV